MPERSSTSFNPMANFYIFAYRFRSGRRHLATHSSPTDKSAERKTEDWKRANYDYLMLKGGE